MPLGPWVVPAITAAGNIIGQGIARGKDKRQLTQQEKLMGIQMKGNKEMMDYAQAKQMEMWQATGYGAQKEQMKAAGLNPALMYGMGGGGGQTTGSIAAMGVTGGQAPSGSGMESEQWTGMGIQMASQLGLMDAQRKNIEADTELKKTDAAKTAGVDTDKTKTEIQSLTQGINNQRAVEILTKVQTGISKIDEYIKDKSKDDQVEIIMWKAGQALEELDKMDRENLVDSQTMNDRVKIVKTELAQKALQNALIHATTTTEKGKPALQAEQIKIQEQQIKTMIQQGIQRWQEIGQGQYRNNTEKLRQEQDAWANDVSKSTSIPIDVIKGIAQAIIFKSVAPGESFEDTYETSDGETRTRRTYRSNR